MGRCQARFDLPRCLEMLSRPLRLAEVDAGRSQRQPV